MRLEALVAKFEYLASRSATALLRLGEAARVADSLRSGGLAALTDSLARTLCWSAAWDMVRDAELATRDYLELVVTGGPAESDIGVVQAVNRQLLRALEVYADPSFATEGRARFADVAITAARAAAAEECGPASPA